MRKLGLAVATLSFSMYFSPSAISQATKNSAFIHFYRYKQFYGSLSKPSIYCDGAEITRIENGRLYEVEMPSGVHSCYSNDRQAGVTFTAEAGKEYYLRADIVNTTFSKAHFRLQLVPPEQGKYEVKGLDSQSKADAKEDKGQ